MKSKFPTRHEMLEQEANIFRTRIEFSGLPAHLAYNFKNNKTMNKLLCTCDTLNLNVIANNHHDLTDHLNSLGYYSVEITDDSVKIIERPGFAPDICNLKWVKHV